jgi:hypothetical protein
MTISGLAIDPHPNLLLSSASPCIPTLPHPVVPADDPVKEQIAQDKYGKSFDELERECKAGQLCCYCSAAPAVSTAITASLMSSAKLHLAKPVAVVHLGCFSLGP